MPQFFSIFFLSIIFLTHNQTNSRTVIATYRLKRPRGWLSEKANYPKAGKLLSWLLQWGIQSGIPKRGLAGSGKLLIIQLDYPGLEGCFFCFQPKGLSLVVGFDRPPLIADLPICQCTVLYCTAPTTPWNALYCIVLYCSTFHWRVLDS